MEHTLRYHLTITDGDKEVVKIEAPTEEFMLEKLGAFERSRRKAPLVVWPPNGSRLCKAPDCGMPIDSGDFCDCSCEYAMFEDQTYKHCEAPDMLDSDTMEQLEEERDKFNNIHS